MQATVFSIQMSDLGSLCRPPTIINIQENTLSPLSLRINYVGKLTEKEQKCISYIDTWKCWWFASLETICVCQSMERSREEGKQCDSNAGKSVFWSNACFLSTLESPTQSCFFGVCAYLLMCIWQTACAWNGEFKRPVPEGIRTSRGLNSSSMTKIHQSSVVNQLSCLKL